MLPIPILQNDEHDPPGLLHASRDQQSIPAELVEVFGADFVRPRRMPTWVPTRRHSHLAALLPWLEEGASLADTPRKKIEFQPYDWGLRCSVA